MVTRVTLKVEEVFADHPTLESERLLLRKIAPEDAPAMHAYTSDPEMVRHLPLNQTYTLEDAQRSVRGFMEMYAARKSAPWGVSLKDTGEHIGICGFENWNAQTDRAEIGFIIAKSQWGRGYATEAAKRVMRFGFEVMQLNRLEARTKSENIASKHVLARLGLQYEGLLREHSYWKGAYHDLELYAVLKREFEALG
ncbi:MAG: family acetyltransferase [Cyanobacteria bacterium RYN_339]|nr:family acetyltransferase [Cyanobacteria bacterium RYN_339]